MEKIRQSAEGSYAARLRLLRVAARRKRGASVALLRTLLHDPDERLARMAAREIVRRRPPDFENMLLKVLTSAPDSVRRVVGCSLKFIQCTFHLPVQVNHLPVLGESSAHPAGPCLAIPARRPFVHRSPALTGVAPGPRL